MWYGEFGTLPTKATSKKLNEWKDRLEVQNHFNWLLNVATNEFKTEGLPDTMDREFLEYTFLFRGKACAYDMYGKPFSMSINPYNTLTVFGKPAEGQAITLDGRNYNCKFYWEYLKNMDEANAVLGYDNNQGYPFINYIIDRAERLADAFRAIDTATKLSKLSGVIKIPEEQKNAVVNMLSDYNNNLPFLIVTTKKGGMPLDIDVMNFNGDSSLIKNMWDNYNNLKAETLSMFGINLNSNSDKKERMTQIEVIGDINMPQITEKERLEKRQEFYDLVNAKWGTNIKVKSNYNDIEEAKKLNEKLDQEGTDNDEKQEI